MTTLPFVESFTAWCPRQTTKSRSVKTIAGAIQSIGARDFDLYLLDYKLPDGSGLEIEKATRLTSAEFPEEESRTEVTEYLKLF